MTNYNIRLLKAAHICSSPHPCKGYVARPQGEASLLPGDLNRSRSGGYIAGLKNKNKIPCEITLVNGRKQGEWRLFIEKRA